MTRQSHNAQVTPPKEVTCDPKWIEWAAFMRRARRALAHGATREGPVIRWHMSGASTHPCLHPVELGAWRSARKSAVYDQRKPATPQAMLVIYGRCRRCDGCLRHRQRQWTARALAEVARSSATGGRQWMVTLTGGEPFREWLTLRAHALAHRDRHDLEGRRWVYLARAFRSEVSGYLKRVRKGVGSRRKPRIRFMCCLEPHKDGFPHAHLLVLEQGPSAVSERLLCDRWKAGHVKAKLCDASSVYYMAKYLSKDQQSLIHASVRFGKSEE